MSFEREEVVRARKMHLCDSHDWGHRCQGIGRIEPGELYLAHVGFIAEMRNFQALKFCRACAGYHSGTELNLRWQVLEEAKYPTPADPAVVAERRERCQRANRFMQAIASCGRKFFLHGDQVSRLEVAETGTVFVWDGETQKRTDTRWPDRWREFSEGGTLQRLVQDLAHFIADGGQLNPRSFGIQPDWYDVWGYGQSMTTVQAAAVEQGIVAALVPA